MSSPVFTCHLYYAPLKGKSGPKFCELSVNNKKAGPNEVQASSLQKKIKHSKEKHILLEPKMFYKLIKQ